MLHDRITELIGNTPLLRLDPAVHGLEGIELYAKLELFNPFGSIKDRTVWGMVGPELERAAAERRTFVEASSGNTVKAMQVLAAMHGLRVHAVTNRVRVDEIRDLLALLGVRLQELPGLSECPDPTVPNDVFSAIDAIVATDPDGYLHPSQYTNPRNPDAHRDGTGREIQADLGRHHRIDYLVGGLGTTGSTRGAGSELRRHHPGLRTVGVVSARDDFIPGIRTEAEMWEVGLFERDFYDDVLTVGTDRAIDGTLALVRGYGVLSGPTGGATYAAALDLLTPLAGARREPLRAVLLVCDRLEPYLSYLRRRRPELFGAAPSRRPTGITAGTPVVEVPALAPAELAARLERPGVLVVDLRGALGYRIGHVPGAVNLPDDQLDRLLDLGVPFPPGVLVVLTCPVGELSARFATRCRARGVDAANLAGGVVAWRDAGLPLEQGLS